MRGRRQGGGKEAGGNVQVNGGVVDDLLHLRSARRAERRGEGAHLADLGSGGRLGRNGADLEGGAEADAGGGGGAEDGAGEHSWSWAVGVER
jgi:hypothetical protein